MNIVRCRVESLADLRDRHMHRFAVCVTRILYTKCGFMIPSLKSLEACVDSEDASIAKLLILDQKATFRRPTVFRELQKSRPRYYEHINARDIEWISAYGSELDLANPFAAAL